MCFHRHPRHLVSASPRCQQAQHATPPSFPTLIHRATQIFSPNPPPFARTPIPLEFGNTIWRDDWIPVPSNITGSLVSCLPGTNKMSCFPFGLLMPLWASFCRSLMCHSEIIALDSDLLVDLEIIGRQQVSPPLSPRPPSMGKPRRWMILRCLPLFLSLSFLLSLSNHGRPQVLTAASATVPLSRF